MGLNPSPLEDLRAVVKANSPEVKWVSETDMDFFKGSAGGDGGEGEGAGW